jgi:hypothetical protein
VDWMEYYDGALPVGVTYCYWMTISKNGVTSQPYAAQGVFSNCATVTQPPPP